MRSHPPSPIKGYELYYTYILHIPLQDNIDTCACLEWDV